MNYIEFLKSKMAISSQSGFEVDKSELTEGLYPHVKDSVMWAIQTVPYCAVNMGRRGLSTELNYDYFMDGVCYLREAESNVTAPTLFSLMSL